MDCPARTAGTSDNRRLRGQSRSIRQIFIDRAWNRIEIQPFGTLRCVEHELRQAFRRGITQLFLHRQAVAFRLADFLRVFVEEQLIGEAFRRLAAQDAADASRQPYGIYQILS